jgi:transglutaminase-like putative cysteine protease
MRYVLLALLVACSSKKQDAPAAPPPAAADPWADKKPVVDPKDPDLSKMAELASGPPGTNDYPQADAVIALDRDDITLRGDGTLVEHHKSIVKLLDPQRGKEKFADVHIPYDQKRQTLELQTTRTVNADGKPHVASPEEIGDIVPPRLADATIYSDVRERVVSFPAVDKGSVVELEYTITTKAGPDAPLGGELLLAAWDPVLDRTVTITTPAAQPPKVSVAGIELKPAETAGAGDTNTWTYHLDKQPDRHPESGQPVDAAVLPRLVYGFQPGWDKVQAPVAARFLKAAVPQPVPAAVKQQADQLVAGAKSEEDKAQKLFAFVAHEVRSVDLPLGWAGYEPHAPDIVLANRYADQRDKVALLLAMCSAEGIAGRPVLVRTGKVPVIQSVPTVAQFDRVIAKVTVDGKEVWLDPSDENGQYGVAFAGQDNLVLPLEQKATELGARPPLDPSSSISQTTAKYALSANGDLDAKYSYQLTGWYADRASAELRPLKGENQAQFFQREAAQLSAAAVAKEHQVGDTMSVSGPIGVEQHVSVPGYSAAQGTFRVFELPPVALGIADDSPSAGVTTRKYPLFVGTPRIEKGEITVEVPAGWKVQYVPPKLEGSAEGVSFTSACEAAGQTVTCHHEVKLDKLVVAPEQYPAFRAAITKLEAYERRIVLLTKA